MTFRKAFFHGILLALAAASQDQPAHAHGAAPGGGHRAHVHGQAELDLTIDRSGFDAELRIPMDSLVGFERPPGSPAEQLALDTALAALQDPNRVLRASTAAECAGRLVGIEKPKWEDGAGAHVDVEARYRFDCAQPGRLVAAEAAVFDSFSRLRRIDVRSIDDSGTRSQRLGRSARVVKLSR